MKFVVTGTTGQVGWELVRALQPLGEVVPVSIDDLDLTDAEATRQLLDRVKPDVVVNPAAHTAVDKAETEQQELARVLNADVPAVLADWCKAHGALLVHYSTDYVFNGEGTRPWKEDDATAPLNVYGATKLAGEQAIQKSGCAHLILRTCWVYSLHGGNFLKTMVRLASSRDHLKVVADQYGVPTPASFIADVTAELIRRRSFDPKLADCSGILNLAPSGETTWHGYAQTGPKLLHEATLAAGENTAQRPRPEWQVPRMPTLEAVPATEFPVPSKRPSNSRLDLSRIQQVWGLRMPPWDELLKTVLRDA